jgi:hypothetical protein
MALTRCPQRSEEVSDKVATCPRCGYSLHASAAQEPSKGTGEVRTEIQNPAARPEPAQSAAPSGIEERFRQIYAEKGAIQAIKYWREVTGASLAQAKAFYDQERASGRLGEAARRQKPQSCSMILLMIIIVLAFAAAFIVITFPLIQRGSYHY